MIAADMPAAQACRSNSGRLQTRMEYRWNIRTRKPNYWENNLS